MNNVKIVDIARAAFKDKKLILKNLRGDRVNVNYVNKHTWLGNHNRKAFILPNTIKIDKNFMESVGLFLGDGDLNRKEKAHLGYCSKDKDVARYVLRFLQKYFLIKTRDITFNVQYKLENKKLKDEWANYLHIPRNKVLTRFSNRHRKEVMHIQVNGVVFRKIFETIFIEILNKDFIKKKALRRGILRGLFAAEGSIGIDYLEKKPYIFQITFCLHIKESHIKSYITKILDCEGINYYISKRDKCNSLEINITNWGNYWKLWQFGLFDICKRKKNYFLEIMENLKIYCILKNEIRYDFFNSLNLRQWEIANIIKSWQGNISKTIKGVHNLTVEQLLTLQKINNFPLEKLKKGCTTLRVGHLTEIQTLEFKNLCST